MFGFKSFADKTKIDFKPGFTALVGPNGCGKSNVVDALKWVLGEKSARSMRGEKMEDVIFAGTDGHKALSMSEVTLEFENSGGLLPIDGDNLRVTRRLYRDGESEYLINNRKVRLKEIESLFYDTGVGKQAYSVMEQGRIDQIVSSKPEERRYIFEEAAGISKYKFQKKETVRKLEETKLNLNRAQDILHEIERDREQKRKQAQTTENYQSLKKELTDYEIKRYVLKSADFLERKSALEEKLSNLIKRREELSAQVSSVNSLIEEREYKKNAIQLELFEQDKQLVAFKHSLSHIEDQLQRNKSLLQEAKHRLDATEQKLEQRKKNIESLDNQLADLIEKQKQLEQEIAELAHQLEEKKNADNQHKNQIIQWEQQLRANRQEIIDIEKNLVNKQELLKEIIGKLVVEIEKRKKELEQDEEKRSYHRQNIYNQLDAIELSVQKIYDLAAMPVESAQVFSDWYQKWQTVVKEVLEPLDMKVLRQEIHSFESFEDGFRSIFFAKGGIQEQKEDLQNLIAQMQSRKEFLIEENNQLEISIAEAREKREILKDEWNQLNTKLTKESNELSWIKKQIEQFTTQRNQLLEQSESYLKEIQTIQKRINDWNTEIFEFEGQLKDFNEKEIKIQSQIRELAGERDSIEQEVSKFKSQIHRERVELNQVQPKIENFERLLIELRLKDEQIQDQLYNEYELDFSDAKEKAQNVDLPENDLNAKISQLKKSIQELGVINHLALDEFKELEERYQFYVKQYQDMLKAQEDIYNIIKDIDQASTKLFIENFAKIRTSFSNIFQKLFQGGKADVLLIDTENPLESGIDIVVHPPGKKPKHISLLSGGERSLVAIALLFAVYEIKPSPFCFLDEIDAALDERNIDRFIHLLDQFAGKSQFIVISHNKRTMAAADTIFGVTMEEPGISKLVSMRLETAKQVVS